MATVRRIYIILYLYTLQFEHIPINNKKGLKCPKSMTDSSSWYCLLLITDQLTAADRPAICWQEKSSPETINGGVMLFTRICTIMRRRYFSHRYYFKYCVKYLMM